MRPGGCAHLDPTLTEATARLDGRLDGGIAASDAIHLHLLHMADSLAAASSPSSPTGSGRLTGETHPRDHRCASLAGAKARREGAGGGLRGHASCRRRRTAAP